MKIYKNLLLLPIFLILFSCGPGLSDVKVGMTESEVEELLGKANTWNSSSNSSTFNGETETHETATWEYNGIGTIEFEDGLVISTHQ